MKKAFILLVLTLPASDSFNTVLFLESCKAAGLKLYADTPTDSPHGFILKGGGKLMVGIYDRHKAAINEKARKQAGNAVFVGDAEAIIMASAAEAEK